MLGPAPGYPPRPPERGGLIGHQAGQVTRVCTVEEAVRVIRIALIPRAVMTEVTTSLVTDTNIMALLETRHRHLVVDCLT